MSGKEQELCRWDRKPRNVLDLRLASLESTRDTYSAAYPPSPSLPSPTLRFASSMGAPTPPVASPMMMVPMGGHVASVHGHNYNDSNINMEVYPSSRFPAEWQGGGGVPGSGVGGGEGVGGVSGLPVTDEFYHHQGGGSFQQGCVSGYPHRNGGVCEHYDVCGPPLVSAPPMGNVVHNANEGTTATLEGIEQFGATQTPASDDLVPLDIRTDMLDNCGADVL